MKAPLSHSDGGARKGSPDAPRTYHRWRGIDAADPFPAVVVRLRDPGDEHGAAAPLPLACVRVRDDILVRQTDDGSTHRDLVRSVLVVDIMPGAVRAALNRCKQ